MECDRRHLQATFDVLKYLWVTMTLSQVPVGDSDIVLDPLSVKAVVLAKKCHSKSTENKQTPLFYFANLIIVHNLLYEIDRTLPEAAEGNPLTEIALPMRRNSPQRKAQLQCD